MLVRPDVIITGITGLTFTSLPLGPIPFAPALIGQQLHGQALAGTSGVGTVLTNAVVVAIPPALPVQRIFAPTMSPSQGFGFTQSGGLVVSFRY